MKIYSETLHIETTNRCTLKCPACPRTVWQGLINKPISKQDINLNDLKNFLDCDSGKQIKTFMLCGDYGDTIYYPNLLNLIKTFRNKKFKIHTNGSYKDKEWWIEFNKLLTTDDTIIFGIDGLREDNNKYRVNADWASIETAIDILSKGPATLKCQTLIFKFNYNKLEEIKKWAHSKNMQWFSLKSMRFGDKDLIPPDEFVQNEELYQEDFQKNTPIEISPKCAKACVVTSDGYFLPCDWIRNPLTFYRSELFLDKKRWIDKLEISRINLDTAYTVLDQWIQNVIAKGKAGQAEVLCKMKCRKL